MTIAWKTQEERGNRGMIQLMAWVARSLGRRVARALLYPICLYYVCRSREANQTLRQYYVRVRGVNQKGAGAPSNEVIVRR